MMFKDMIKPLGKFFKKRIVKGIRVRLVRGNDEIILFEYKFNPPKHIQKGYDFVFEVDEGEE